ncbi:acetyl-CoA carboxylase biotin carboxylase subunit [Pseudonocardia ailaonensis]|uniref:biotin carboxylase n=1 Tax=Pseudonocardia ailaonensis TaxID=367279 RepID=A0ABN2MIC3_9PSEU
MRVLIANRGEIALRVLRACRELGMEAVVAHSAADAGSAAVRAADQAFCIGPGPAAQSYLSIGALMTAVRATGADAVHPGYGFLSESASFADACAEAGVRFVGPGAGAIRLMGDKISARRVAEEASVPVVPGRVLGADAGEAAAVIRSMGGSVLVKAAAGGGGRGMRLVDADGSSDDSSDGSSDDIAAAVELARAEASAAFSDGTLYAERYVARGRHVEVQVFGTADGVVGLGERDCSVQRRHQKLIEESPCGVLDAGARDAMRAAAVRLAERVGYRGAGTVEFLWDLDAGAFFFLEMNTRLQVEHGVTEMRTGVDIVRQQLLLAATGSCELDAARPPQSRGHVIEARVLAEDPTRGFRPTPGRVTRFRPPAGPGVRVDTALGPGDDVPPYYDSLIAKVVVEATTREHAISRMRRALDEFEIEGVHTTLTTLDEVLGSEAFRADEHTTSWFDRAHGIH